MKNECDTLRRALSACGWIVALLASSSAVMAQSARPSEPVASSRAESAQATVQAPDSQPQDKAADAEALDYAPLQVGDATQSLLAWQRGGDIASKTPRTISGNVAQRSYERYLKSFEFSIPERMSSTVKTSTGNGGGK